jgi:hypothetical protein
MAMKKDDDKSKRTLSGKKPATFGGANSKLIKPKPTALTSAGPRAEPPRPMGRDASGSANFNRTSPSRATVSVGPATLNVGGKTAKSTGGMNMTGGTVKPKKSSTPMDKKSSTPLAKSGSAPTKGVIVMNQKELDAQDARAKKSKNIALIAGGTILGAGVAISGKKIGEKIGQAAKYIANTKERKAAKRAQKAENDAMIVERNKGKGTMKASKSTMKKLKGR